MIDHVSVGVPDIKAAGTFYDPVLKAIGIDRMAAMDTLLAYGRDAITFVAILPHDGGTNTAGNGTHVAFHAQSNEEVDAFHAEALRLGGTSEGAPGTRAYPHAEVYAAFVRDPFGNKLEAIVGGFAA